MRKRSEQKPPHIEEEAENPRIHKLLLKMKSIVGACSNTAKPMKSKTLWKSRSIRPFRKKSRAKPHPDDLASTIGDIISEESMLTFNHDLQHYWTKMFECARKKKDVSSQISLIERRKKVLEAMNVTGFSPKSKGTRMENIRIEEGNLKVKGAEKNKVDMMYRTLMDYRREINHTMYSSRGNFIKK